MVKRVFTLLLIVAWVGPSYGEGITVSADGQHVTVTNTGNATVIGLKVGQATIARLKPKESSRLKAAADVAVHGRFALSEWHLALNELGPLWAPFHLRTSGFLLDALQSGPLGDPAQAANILALKESESKAMAAWAAGPELRMALVARAARHAPPSLTARLMGLNVPIGPKTSGTRPPAYAGLESVTDSLRIAIEQHGSHPDILKALADHSQWAADRGFEHRPLLDSLAGAYTSGQRGSQVSPKMQVQALVQALDQGREADASKLAVEAATSGARPSGALLARLTCAGLDSGARRSLKGERWLAAEAYLRLAGRVCGDRISHRARVAEFFRRRGDIMVQSLNLAAALDWFRAALWFGGDRQDRARLADTHAELAILGFRSLNPVSAQEHLDQANHYGPYRPRVVAASDLKPKADPRARFGLIIIIIFVAFFALRRLLRLFSDRHSRPRLD